MNLLLSTLAVCLLAATVYGQQCGSEAMKTLTCILPKALEVKEQFPEEMDEETKAVKKEAIKKCFEDAGCSHPGTSDLMDAPPPLQKLAKMAASMGIIGLDMTKLKIMFKTAMKCGKELKKKFKPVMETCIQDKNDLLADFELPDPDLLEKMMGGSNEMDGMTMPTVGGFLLRVQEEMDQKMKKVAMTIQGTYDKVICPEGIEQSRKVRTCIEALVDEYTPEQMKCKTPIHMMYMLADVKNNMCDVVDTCTEENMSEPCIEICEEKLVDYCCDCSRDLLIDKWLEMRDDMMVCMEKEMGEKPNFPTVFTAKNGPMFKYSMKVLDKVCAMAKDEKNDVCKNPYWSPLDVLGKGGPKPGYGSGSGERGPPPPRMGPPPRGPPPPMVGPGGINPDDFFDA